MSNTKRYWENEIADMAERTINAKIADILGIAPNELDEVDWEIVAEKNKDGFICGYYVNFTSDSNPVILERIGAEHESVYLDHHLFDEQDDYYYDYYDEELAWERASDSHFSDFRNSTQHIRSLASLQVPDSEQFALFVMLYMHATSSFEHILYRCFQHEVTKSSENMKQFVETNPEFKNRKFTLDQIFSKRDQIESIVAEYIKDVIFHRIDKVVPMYRSVLAFEFGDCDWIGEAFSRRHDCAHRAGHTKNGDRIDLSKQVVMDLTDKCKQFVERLEDHIKKAMPTERPP